MANEANIMERTKAKKVAKMVAIVKNKSGFWVTIILII